MRRITPVLLLALVIGPVHGQLGEKVRNTLVNVSTTLPDYDTTYVAAYRSNLVISVVSNWHDIDLSLERDEGGDLSYSTNSRGQYGFSLNYKWLSAEITFGVPALDGHDASYGNTSSRGFGLGYTGRRLWAASSGTRLRDSTRTTPNVGRQAGRREIHKYCAPTWLAILTCSP